MNMARTKRVRWIILSFPPENIEWGRPQIDGDQPNIWYEDGFYALESTCRAICRMLQCENPKRRYCVVEFDPNELYPESKPLKRKGAGAAPWEDKPNETAAK
jgi:hypothetical protein